MKSFIGITVPSRRHVLDHALVGHGAGGHPVEVFPVPSDGGRGIAWQRRVRGREPEPVADPGANAAGPSPGGPAGAAGRGRLTRATPPPRTGYERSAAAIHRGGWLRRTPAAPACAGGASRPPGAIVAVPRSPQSRSARAPRGSGEIIGARIIGRPARVKKRRARARTCSLRARPRGGSLRTAGRDDRVHQESGHRDAHRVELSQQALGLQPRQLGRARDGRRTRSRAGSRDSASRLRSCFDISTSSWASSPRPTTCRYFRSTARRAWIHSPRATRAGRAGASAWPVGAVSRTTVAGASAALPDERVRDRDQREELVDPGRRQRDEVLHHRAVEGGIEVRAASQRVEELVHRGAIALARGGQRALRVQLARARCGVRPGRPSRRRRAAPPGVGQGMRGVRRREQDAPVRPVRGRREGGQWPQAVVLPTPPFPPNTRRRRDGGMSSESHQGSAARVDRRAALLAVRGGHGPRRSSSRPSTQRRGEAPQGADAFGLVLLGGHDTQRDLTERTCGLGQDLGLRPAAAPAQCAGPRGGGVTRFTTISLTVMPARPRPARPSRVSSAGQRFRQHHPRERRPLRVARGGRGSRPPPPPPPRSARPRCPRGTTPPRAAGEEPVLGLHVVEDGGDLAQRLRHLQEAQGVAGGRGVHHHDVHGRHPGEARSSRSPISSSVPGSERDRNRSTSSRSR